MRGGNLKKTGTKNIYTCTVLNPHVHSQHVGLIRFRLKLPRRSEARHTP